MTSSSYRFYTENLIAEAAHVKYEYFMSLVGLLIDLLPDKLMFRGAFFVTKAHIDLTKVISAAEIYVRIHDELGEVVEGLLTLCSF